MSSPPSFRPGRLSVSPSRASSSSSSPASHSPRRNQHNQQPLEAFQLHRYLHTTQHAVVENIFSYIIWDLREDPLTSAQDVYKLDTPTARLSPELLNAYATDPPIAILHVACEYPKPWTLVVYASALAQAVGSASGSGTGARNTFPVYPPVDMHRRGHGHGHGHGRSSSASPQGGTAQLVIPGPPNRPTMPTVPLPAVTPSSTPALSPVIISTATLTPPTTATATATGVGPSREVGITISDLLQAIYNHLHSKSVSSGELSTLQPKQRALIEDAYDKRRRMSASSPTRPQFHGTESLLGLSSPMSPTFAVNFTPPGAAASTSSTITDGSDAEGMKKVDTLSMHTLFAGLDIDPSREHSVILSLRRPS